MIIYEEDKDKIWAEREGEELRLTISGGFVKKEYSKTIPYPTSPGDLERVGEDLNKEIEIEEIKQRLSKSNDPETTREEIVKQRLAQILRNNSEELFEKIKESKKLQR